MAGVTFYRRDFKDYRDGDRICNHFDDALEELGIDEDIREKIDEIEIDAITLNVDDDVLRLT